MKLSYHSTYLTGSNGTDDGILELRYCPNCKICKDKELFRSYNKKMNIIQAAGDA